MIDLHKGSRLIPFYEHEQRVLWRAERGDRWVSPSSSKRVVFLGASRVFSRHVALPHLGGMGRSNPDLLPASSPSSFGVYMEAYYFDRFAYIFRPVSAKYSRVDCQHRWQVSSLLVAYHGLNTSTVTSIMHCGTISQSNTYCYATLAGA